MSFCFKQVIYKKGADIINFIEAMIYLAIVVVILVVIASASIILGSFVADYFRMEGILWWAFMLIFVLLVCKVLN